MKKFILVITLIIFILCGCTTNQEKTIETNTVTYKDATFEVPADWKQREQNDNSIYFYVSNNDFLVVSEKELDVQLNESFFNIYVSALGVPDRISEFEILSKGSKTINEKAYFIADTKCLDNGKLMYYHHVLVEHNLKLYSFIMSSAGDTFPYTDEMNLILNSLKFENNSTPSAETSAPEPAPKKELSERDKMILKITELFEQDLAFDVGSYVMGDIPKGEYAFIGINSSKYYCEKDAAGNIIDNENFQSFGYVYVHGLGNVDTRGVLVSVNTFETLGVTGAKQLYEILNKQTNYTQGGMYKVGLDIPAGTYTIESIGNGYFALLTGPVGNNDIIDNDNFTGKKQVYASNGQYLELSRCQLIVSQ